MDLPGHFASWKGAHNRLRKWTADGTWEKVFTALLTQADAEGDLDRVVAVGSTIVRAHQHAAGARQKGPGRRAGRPCHRTVPRRTDHHGPPHRGQPLPSAGLRPHAWPGG
jgi:transposase